MKLTLSNAEIVFIDNIFVMFEKYVISTDIGMGSKCATLLYDLFLYLVFVSIILHPKACYEKRKQANPVLLIFVPLYG